MTKVNFELGSDASDFLSGFRQASAAVIELENDTKDLSEVSKKVFKSNADEVQKFSDELEHGANQTKKMREEATNLGKTQNIIKQLKQQIKEYTTEAYKAGEGTKAFKENLEKAGALKDQLADLNAQVNALNGNMGENFARAAGGSISLVAKGYEGLTAFQVLAGDKSKEFEETLLRLQSLNAMASVAQEFAGISDKLTEIKLGFAPVAELFTSGASSIASSYTSANQSLVTFFSNFGGNAKSALKSGIDFFKNFGSNAVSVAKAAGAGFVSFFQNFGTNMKQFAVNAKAGINTIGTAIKNNPLGIILTVVTAAVAAFVLLRNKVKPIADLFDALGEVINYLGDSFEKMGQKFGLVASDLEKSLEDQINNVDKVVDKIGNRYDFEIKKAQAVGKETTKLEKEKTIAQANEINKQLGNLYALAQLNGKLTEDQRKQMADLFDKRRNLIQEASVFAIKVEKEAADKEKELQKKRQDQAKQAADKRKQQEQDLLNSLNDLAKRSQQAQLEGLTGKERLDKQREIAEKELAVLRETIIKKKQLLGEGNKLSVEEQKQFDVLESRIVEEHNAGIIKLETEKANKLAEIQTKEVTDAQKALELKTKIQEDSIKAIPKPGNLTQDQEAQFELQKQQELLNVRKSYLSQALALKTQEINARANQEIIALQNEKALLANNNDEISKLRVAAIEKDINAIREGAELSKEALVTETKATVNEINEELAQIGEKTKPKKLDVNKLLGLDSTELSSALKKFGENNQIDIKVSPESIDAAKNAVQQLVASLKELMQAYFEAQNEALNNELKANQERIDARDQNIQDLRDKLAEEESLRDQGLANNVDRIREEIAAQEAAKQADLQRQREIQEEKKKLAKQQLIIDTAMQASQLVLAIAQLFAQGSSFWVGPVPVGLIVAGLAATAMTASFVVGKKKAFDAVNSGAAQLYTGGYTGDGGKYEEANAVVHKGEYVMNQDKTNKHWDLLHGIHTDDKSLMEAGIRDLIAGKGIYLASDIPEEINTTKNALRTAELKAFYKVDNSVLEKRMESIEGYIREISSQGKNKETVLPNGTRIINKGSLTTIIRPKQ